MARCPPLRVPETKRNEKACWKAGFFHGLRKTLLDLGFLIGNMLASHRIKLFDFHLFWMQTLVFGGGVEMAGAGSGFKLDFFTHDELLGLNRLTAGAQIGEHGFDTVLVDQTQCCTGDAQTHPALFAFEVKTTPLQIGQKATLGTVVGVGNIISHHGAFARYLTHARHGRAPETDS
jgi:hypothetical protein